MIDSISELGNLLTPYYIGHLAMLLLYLPLRQSKLLGSPNARAMFGGGSGTMTEDWLTQEQEIFAVAFVVLFLKARKVATVQEFLDKTYTFGKLAVFAVLLRMSAWGWCAAYTLVALAAFALLRAPRFGGEECFEDIHTEGDFDRRIRNPQGDDKKVHWVVVFGADWCSKCGALEPLFARLSTKHTDERRKWAKVDLEQLPALASEFSISMDTWKNTQLPTVMTFYRGKELKRLPLFSSSGKVVPCHFGEAEVVKVLQLNEDTAALRSKAKAERRGGGAAAAAPEAANKAGKKDD